MLKYNEWYKKYGEELADCWNDGIQTFSSKSEMLNHYYNQYVESADDQ